MQILSLLQPAASLQSRQQSQCQLRIALALAGCQRALSSLPHHLRLLDMNPRTLLQQVQDLNQLVAYR